MKIRYLAWLIPLFLLCCKKSNNNNTNKSAGFTFTTTYDSVITSYANDSFVFSFNVNVLTGSITGNPVTYSISGLPANVTVTPDSILVQDLLSGIFKFNFGNIQAGNDTVNFTISSAVYGIQKHKLILNILPPTDYSSLLAGTYPGAYNYCTPIDSIYHFSSVVSAVTGTPYTITISNVMVYDTSFTVTASLSNIVTVHFQTIGAYTIWGSGNYTHDNPPNSALYQITMYDTVVHGLDTEACLIHIAH